MTRFEIVDLYQDPKIPVTLPSFTADSMDIENGVVVFYVDNSKSIMVNLPSGTMIRKV